MPPEKPTYEPTALQVLTDEALIDRAKKDPRAFEGLYDRYFTVIFNFILKRVNDQETAADITQQVFFNALTHIRKYRHQGHPFSAFLFRIAINECNQYFRDRRKVRFVPLTGEYIGHIRHEFAWPGSSEPSLFDQLKKELMQLDHEQLLLIELRFFERKSFKEIAFLLNITENLAKVRTYRLLEKLKVKIEQAIGNPNR